MSACTARLSEYATHAPQVLYRWYCTLDVDHDGPHEAHGADPKMLPYRVWDHDE